MKTAMQELIEHIQINATKFSLMNTYNILKEIEPYLEKEKEQIKNAYIIGFSDCHSSSAKNQDLYFKLLYNGKDI
jgi:outer membrane protein OmpA-like peptidoglycan-associated protein